MQARIDGRVAALVFAITIMAAPAAAQDSNYWSTAYGTRSLLLGGVVTGSPGDISSVYYNPGALALSRNTELLLAGSAYQYQRIGVDGGSGPGRDLVSSRVAAVPSLFAGEIPVLDHDRIAYSFLGRQEVNVELDSRFTSVASGVLPLPSSNFAAFQLEFRQDVSESWFGMTWAHMLTEGLGFGISPYVAVRTQNTRLAVLAENQSTGGELSVMTVSREFDYMHYRLLARIGLSGVRDSLTYGVTLTTPGLGLFGGGSSQSNTALVDETGTFGRVIGASYQDELDAEYHSPLGVGVGGSYGWGGTRLHVAAEWYAEVPRYDVLRGSSYTINTPLGDSTVVPFVEQRLGEVFNYGVGLEHRFSPSLVGYASYHTDQTGYRPGDAPSASVTSWDLQHVSGGVTWKVWRSDITVGVSTAFGSEPLPPVPNNPANGAVARELESSIIMVTALAGWKITF